MGLVIRVKSEKDERNLIVTITKKGDELKEQAVKIPEQVGACIKLSPADA